MTNLLWHLANKLLLFLALERLTGARWPSFLVAALFAVHPLNVQTVAWVSERKGLISTFFWMSALWCYARYVERPSWRRYALVALALALGLMAKQMVVTLPCVLLLLDFWPLRRLTLQTRSGALPRLAGLGSATREKLPLLGLVLAASALTIIAQAHSGAITSLPLDARLKNALSSYVVYLRQAVYPVGLAAFYPHAGNALSTAQACAAAVLLAVASWLALRALHTAPYVAVGWFWYLGTLVPVIGIVQVGAQGHADRYGYVPLIGLFMAAAWSLAGLARRWQRQRTAALLAGLVLACFMTTSWGEAHYWQNSVALWQQTLRVTGGSDVACNNLAGALMSRGAYEQAGPLLQTALQFNPANAEAHFNLGKLAWQRGNWQQATRHFQESLRWAPLDAETHPSVAMAKQQQGKLAESLPHVHEALRLDPTNPQAQNCLGIVRLRKEDAAAAAHAFEQALRFQPTAASVHVNLALAYQLQGRDDAALERLRHAVALEPNSARFHRVLALSLHQRGRGDEAAAEYRESLRIDADWPQRLTRLAWSLVLHPDREQRDGAQALRLAQQLLQAAAKPAPELLELRAAAHAEMGDFRTAAEIAGQAKADAVAANNASLAREIEGHVALYQQGRPLHFSRQK